MSVDGSPRRNLWLVGTALLWLAGMLGSMFVWLMFAGVGFSHDNPIIEIGLWVIPAVFALTYVALAWLISRNHRTT